jgi:hypothetical protein
MFWAIFSQVHLVALLTLTSIFMLQLSVGQFILGE